MDFHSKRFHELIRYLDPRGMLHVPFNVFDNKELLIKFFKSDNDFRKLDVAWMCDQLVILLANFDNATDDSSVEQILQNDSRRLRFILISRTFIGLILIQKFSTQAYIGYCQKSTVSLFRTIVNLYKKPRKKRRMDPIAINQPCHKEVIQSQQIEPSHQNQIVSGSKKHSNEESYVLLNHPKQIENATEINLLDSMNLAASNIPILYNQNKASFINNALIVDSRYRRSHLEQQKLSLQPILSIEEFPVSEQNVLLLNQPIPQQKLGENIINIDDEQQQNLQAAHLIDQPQCIKNLQKQPNQIYIENGSTQNNLPNQPLKRKISHEIVRRNFKKRPIEQSSKVLKNRLKKLEGDLPNRPFEYLISKYVHKSMNHLPLRYGMYYKQVNIPFSALTLYMELEENKNYDDVLNNEITMSGFKNIVEKLCYSSTSNTCIYQQCMNNSLPHIVTDSTYNSSVYRHTMNEIEVDISPIPKVNLSKWKDFKEKMKHQVKQSLLVHKTLVGTELSGINIPSPEIFLPIPHQINEFLNDKTIDEPRFSTEMLQIDKNNIHHSSSHSPPKIKKSGLPMVLPPYNHSKQFNVDLENYDFDGSNELRSSQNVIELVEKNRNQSIDIMQIIFNTIQTFPEKAGYLMFTDLCPMHVTFRKNATSVLAKLVGMHKQKIIKLSQPCNTMEPSSVLIELNTTFD